MKRSEHDRLLREILADENVERLRASSLDGMLTATRRRRRRSALMRGAAASVVVTLTLLIALYRRPAPPAAAEPRPSRVATAGTVKILDDQQLLALFPDRSVALIGRTGEQRLMFLDEPRTSSATGKTQ
jgi:hypothetical protein